MNGFFLLLLSLGAAVPAWCAPQSPPPPGQAVAARDLPGLGPAAQPRLAGGLPPGGEEWEEDLLACGVERWSVKTGTDADAGLVDLGSVTSSTIASLVALTKPPSLPANNRVVPAETTVWQISATLTKFKLETDSDYHLVLDDGLGHTMIAEIASPTCVGAGSPFLAGIANARDEFDAVLTATTSFQTVSIPVLVTGVGFFDFNHGQTGVAPNCIELHPLLDIIFYPSGDFSLSRNPAGVTVPQGGGGTVAVTTGVTGGFSAAVYLSASGLPAGAAADVVPAVIPSPGAGTAAMTLTAGAATPVGSVPITVTATGGGRTHTTTVTLEVTAPGGTAEVSPLGAAVPFTIVKAGPAVVFRFQYLGASGHYHLYGAPDAASMNAGVWATKICDLQNNGLGAWASDGATTASWSLADGAGLPAGKYVVVLESAGAEGPYGFQSNGTSIHPDTDRTTPDNVGCLASCASVAAAIEGVSPGAAVPLGTAQTFTGSGSGQGAVTVEWDFDYDWTTFTPEANGTSVSHTYGIAGEYTVALRVTDSCADPGPQSVLDTVGVTVNSVACGPLVVVSQVYGGGGNSGATYKNDFIELFNRGDQAQDLTGWSVQYAAATGGTWSATPLSGTIPPGRYYLVQEALGAGGTADLPTPDATGTIGLSATSGKVALVNTGMALSGTCPAGASIVDLVGYGTTANCMEGSGAAPAPSNTEADLRAGQGCTDTGQNASDFTAGAPAPRNGAAAAHLCACP